MLTNTAVASFVIGYFVKSTQPFKPLVAPFIWISSIL